MKPERLLLGLVAALLMAGAVVWAVGGAAALRSVGVWLWVAAFGVACLPLLLLAVVAVWRALTR